MSLSTPRGARRFVKLAYNWLAIQGVRVLRQLKPRITIDEAVDEL
jgi:hypothetical protein